MSGARRRRTDVGYLQVYAYIMARSTANKGWTRAQLQAWNVDWPPREGWKERLILEVLQHEPNRTRWNEAQIAAVIGVPVGQDALPWDEQRA